MTVVCLVILAGIFWGDFFLKNYIESHVDEREEREICRGEFLIRKHHNKGMMLNAGQKRRRLVAVVSLVFTLILTIVFIVSLGTSRQQFAATGTIAVAWWCLQQYL